MSAAASVAGGVYLWPRQTVMLSGTDAPYALLLAWMGAALMARLVVVQAASRPRGLLFTLDTLVVSGEMIAVLALSADLFSLMLRSFFVPELPMWVLVAFLAGLGTWLGARPVEALGRAVQFWLPLLLLSAAVAGLASISGAPWALAALPSPTISLTPVARGAMASWYLWISAGAHASFATHLRRPERASSLVLVALLIQLSVVALFYVLVLASVGPHAATLIQWPVIYVVNNIRLNGFLVSSLGLVLVSSWTVAVLLYLAVHLRNLGVRWALVANLTAPGESRLIWAFGAAVCAVAVAIPWGHWPLAPILVGWLGPVDLLRLAALVLPLAALSRLRGRAGA